MSERNSPWFQAGLEDGAADAARNPRVRRGFDPARARSWMYRRGFARGFLAVRALARQGCVDDRPATLAAMQRGLDDAWAAVDALAGRDPA
jgi:hypothetical protein